MAWQDAASLDELRDARPWLALAVGGVDIVVGSIEEGWFGVEDRCAHAGCAFSEDGELEGATLICNCHGSEYDVRTGEVRRGPADQPIRTFAVRIAGDRIEVDV